MWIKSAGLAYLNLKHISHLQIDMEDGKYNVFARLAKPIEEEEQWIIGTYLKVGIETSEEAQAYLDDLYKKLSNDRGINMDDKLLNYFGKYLTAEQIEFLQQEVNAGRLDKRYLEIVHGLHKDVVSLAMI